MTPIFLNESDVESALKCFADSIVNGYHHINCPDDARPTSVRAYYTKCWVIYLKSLEHGIVMERSHFELKQIIDTCFAGIFIVPIIITSIIYTVYLNSIYAAIFVLVITFIISIASWMYLEYWWDKSANDKDNCIILTEQFSSLLSHVQQEVLFARSKAVRYENIISNVTSKIAGVLAGQLGGSVIEKLTEKISEIGVKQFIEYDQLSKINSSIDNMINENRYLIGVAFHKDDVSTMPLDTDRG